MQTQAPSLKEETEMYIGVGTVVGIILLVLLLMWIF
jgi:hypothetical protein